jgi:starch-binding outer membrane protein, SusD/RagB family
MKQLLSLLSLLLLTAGCGELLNPQPVDRVTDDLVLKDAASARVALTSAYRDLANLSAPTIVAGDLTADNLIHNGTFTQYLEISNKDMSASNGSASALWGVIYSMTYVVNFLLEGLPPLELTPSVEQELSASARFLRGYAYFIGAYTYGGLPIVTTTEIDVNRVVPRATLEETLAFAEEDLLFALDKVPEESFNAGEISNGAVKAALARFYLYQGDYVQAERYASDVIEARGTQVYQLEESFEDVLADFSRESILEIVYTANDNPGTSTNFSINNLLEGRRELIPSNEMVEAMQNNGGDRQIMLQFNAENSRGADNGWTVVRYGPFDNVPVFRLSELYLIRAEVKARNGNLNGAAEDLNRIRGRAGMPLLNPVSQGQMLQAIEDERRVELAFEGHRWYDLKRTGRIQAVMEAFSNRWTETDLLWPVPLQEIQNNPSLRNAQNPGY